METGGDGKSNVVNTRTFLGSKALFNLLVGLAVVWIVLGVLKVIIGSIYVHDCSVQPAIPVWLILDAFIPVLFLGFWPHLKDDSSEVSKMRGSIALCLASFLSVAWSICGGVWIYPNWGWEFECNQVLKTFAFTMLTINWSLMSAWCQLTVRMSCVAHARKTYMVM